VSERRLDPATLEWTDFAAADASGCDLCSAAAEAGADGAVVVVPSSPDAECVLYAGGHGATLAGLDATALRLQVDVWADRYRELGAREDVDYVLVSDDGGNEARHPHVRVDAFAAVPPRAQRKLEVAAARLRDLGSCVVCDAVAAEVAEGSRVVAENGCFVAYVPYAARLPYELHVTAHRHATSLLDLTDAERDAFAELLRDALVRLGACTGGAPYALALHQSPTDDGHWLAVSHFHAELFPLPARATGAEIATGAWVNTLLPERAAAELRAAR
jgi:UDPglucose--hexose-1-phosphate uridylyltransferase